jgi:hypothetical protein
MLISSQNESRNQEKVVINSPVDTHFMRKSGHSEVLLPSEESTTSRIAAACVKLLLAFAHP